MSREAPAGGNSNGFEVSPIWAVGAFDQTKVREKLGFKINLIGVTDACSWNSTRDFQGILRERFGQNKA